jgi:hypothetical protein
MSLAVYCVVVLTHRGRRDDAGTVLGYPKDSVLNYSGLRMVIAPSA